MILKKQNLRTALEIYECDTFSYRVHFSDSVSIIIDYETCSSINFYLFYKHDDFCITDIIVTNDVNLLNLINFLLNNIYDYH